MLESLTTAPSFNKEERVLKCDGKPNITDVHVSMKRIVNKRMNKFVNSKNFLVVIVSHMLP